MIAEKIDVYNVVFYFSLKSLPVDAKDDWAGVQQAIGMLGAGQANSSKASGFPD